MVRINYLCPFCDQTLGPRVEEWFEGLKLTTMGQLPKLMASLWKKTKPTPRVTNPQGRRVTKSLMELQKKVCDQHRYETHILPLSVQYRWPREPSFYHLLGLLLDPSVETRVQWIHETPASGLMIDNPELVLKSRDIKYLEDQTSLFLMGGAA